MSNLARRRLTDTVTDLHLQRIAALERDVGASRYLGWALDADGRFRVDIREEGGDEVLRFYGPTLHLAIGDARRALRGTCAA